MSPRSRTLKAEPCPAAPSRTRVGRPFSLPSTAGRRIRRVPRLMTRIHEFGRRVNTPLRRHFTWVLAGYVLGILGMLLLPMPSLVLDLLPASNIAAAFSMVLTAIFLREG